MCDSCSTAFYDEGMDVDDDLDLIAHLGCEITDHNCDDPDSCICSCQ